MLTPTPIREVWDEIRPKMAQVKDIRGGNWRPEDIYAACVHGDAFLYTAPEGFVVLRPMNDEFAGTRFLLVWLAYGEGGDCIAKYQGELLELARSAGFSRLQFWRRPLLASASGGWAKAFTIYEMEVPQ
jgi:hypothetical protein